MHQTCATVVAQDMRAISVRQVSFTIHTTYVYHQAFGSVCESECQNGGIRSSPNTCVCDTVYEGAYCQTDVVVCLCIPSI